MLRTMLNVKILQKQRLLLGLWGVLLLPISLTGCDYRDLEITFVVPPEFRGVIRVWEDPKSPHQAFLKESTLRSLKLSLIVPDCGDLPLQETQFFFRWHKTVLEFSNSGSDYTGSFSSLEDGQVQLFSGGAVAYGDATRLSPTYHILFVGTLMEYQAFLRENPDLETNPACDSNQ